MHLPWFKRFGIFFLPITLMGWSVLLAGATYLVYLFIAIDSVSHSVSDTLRPFVFNLFIVGVIYTGIGFLTSRNVRA